MIGVIEPCDWEKAYVRCMIGISVYATLKPLFDGTKLEDRMDDLRESDGLVIIFSKDYSTSFPRLIMETTKLHKSGKTEMISRDCFGMDCGLDVVKDAVASMIFRRLEIIKED